MNKKIIETIKASVLLCNLVKEEEKSYIVIQPTPFGSIIKLIRLSIFNRKIYSTNFWETNKREMGKKAFSKCKIKKIYLNSTKDMHNVGESQMSFIGHVPSDKVI